MIDAHVHIFDYVTRNKSIKYYQIPETSGTETSKSFTPEILVEKMEKCSVEKAVLLQGPYYGNQNDFVMKAIQKFPGRFAGALYIDPWEKNSEEVLDQLLGKSEFTAVKLECSVPTGLLGLHKQSSLTDKQIINICEKCENSGHVMTLDLGAVGTRSYQTLAIRELALRFKNLQFVICHLGQPNPEFKLNKRLYMEWKKQIELGLLPNVCFDASSFPAYFSHEIYPFPSAVRYFQEAVDMIGPEKIMWGSDAPGLLEHAQYGKLMDLSEIYFAEMNQKEQEMIGGLNASRVYFKE